MSDPISDLKHELLAAAVRQQSHAATGREWTRAHSRRRWVIVAVAGLVLVGGLLVTPAFGIGDRLLSLIQSKPTPLDVQAPAWSPDGRTIVFVSWRDGNGEVYAMDANGSGPRNLTQNPAKDVRPAWSPDGRSIAFVSSRSPSSRCKPGPGRGRTTIRDLRHERRREQEAEPHAGSCERRPSNLVTRRAEDRVLARPRPRPRPAVCRERRR